MYSASAMGAYLPTGDPTLTPRWLLMMAGGLFIGGLVAGVSGGPLTFTAEEKSFLAGLGGKVAAGFGVVYLAAGLWAASVQPEIVKAGLAGSGYPLYKISVLPDTAGWRWWWWPFWWPRLPDSARSRRLDRLGSACCLPCWLRSCFTSTATACAT
jgi:hypothetical protein